MRCTTLGDRKITSFRVSEPLWNRFKNSVEAKGFSTCFILETLIRAWLTPSPADEVYYKSSSINVHQNIVYEVAKSRRRRGGVSHAENCYKNNCWTYRHPEEGEALSNLGHVSECECGVCKPFVVRIQRPGSRA